jgi:hypothetical protein
MIMVAIIPSYTQMALNTTGSTTSYELFVVHHSTSTSSYFDRELLTLEALEATEDTAAFLDQWKRMRWEQRPAEDIVRGVKLALRVDAAMAARDLSALGARRFPGNPELVKMARVLAPPRLIGLSPAKPGAGDNMKWLRENATSYLGRWVALKDGNLLAIGDSLKELVSIIGDPRKDGILITRV